jgi:chloramphenicol 3-O-phosphotransferase
MRMLANKLTQRVRNNDQGDAIGTPKFEECAQKNAVTAQAGQIVLINGGHNTGTLHSSTIPARGTVTPSCFMVVSCIV